MAARTIIHADMDAFYASVEQRDHPELTGRPVAVGGDGRRGVVAAASYEARRYGVHSAMPSVRAKQLCPELVFIQPRMQVYREVSEHVFHVFAEFTPLIEALSLDEAFLDASASLDYFGGMTALAARLRSRVRESTGLPVSLGIAPNKYLAKIASARAKPDGLLIVEEQRMQRFLDPLPVRYVWGIGKRAQQTLATHGVDTIADLRQLTDETLHEVFGNRAAHFRRLARGIDEREVQVEREAKSVGAEHTFETDLREEADISSALLALAERVGSRLRRARLQTLSVTVKLRQSDFETVTRVRTLKAPSAADRMLHEIACDTAFSWWNTAGRPPLRLLGIAASRLVDIPEETQQDLFDNARTSLDEVVDQARLRYGPGALRRGRLL